LQWLHKRLQPYNGTFWYPALQWRCADVGKKFNRLDAVDFTSCNDADGVTWTSTTASDCEDLIPTTTPALTYPSDPRLELSVGERSEHSVTVQWSVVSDVDVAVVVVTHQRVDSNVTIRLELDIDQTHHVLTGLQPNTAYNICIELMTDDDNTSSSHIEMIVTCHPVTTPIVDANRRHSWLSLASLELIIGIGVGGALVSIIIVSVAVYCCCAARRRRKRPITSSAPKPSVQTKRFRKLGTVASSPQSQPGGTASEPTSNQNSVTQTDMDRAIAKSVEQMDPESREVLVNLLRTASAYSLDNIAGGTTYYLSPQSTSGGAAGYQPTTDRSDGRHYYESLPDDTYDQIPTDDFV